MGGWSGWGGFRKTLHVFRSRTLFVLQTKTVAFLWKEKEDCLALAKEDVEIESKVWDVVPVVTELCYETSGKKVENTAAACLYNFGYTSTGETLKKTLASDFKDEYGVPFGNLPVSFCVFM